MLKFLAFFFFINSLFIAHTPTTVLLMSVFPCYLRFSICTSFLINMSVKFRMYKLILGLAGYYFTNTSTSVDWYLFKKMPYKAQFLNCKVRIITYRHLGNDIYSTFFAISNFSQSLNTTSKPSELVFITEIKSKSPLHLDFVKLLKILIFP